MRAKASQIASDFVEALYQGLLADPQLRPMFTRNVEEEIRTQKAFFEELFGGRSLYTEEREGGSLKEIHQHIWITAKAAGAWLKHAGEALASMELGKGESQSILAVLAPLAKGLINEEQAAPHSGYLRCERAKPLKKAVSCAHKGDVEGLAQYELHPTALVAAAARGRVKVVEYLLKKNVDPNVPGRLGSWGSLMQTSLEAALAKKRKKVIPLLLEAGAVLDIFGAARLGNVDCLRWILQGSPELANAVDPAEDFRKLRALHYAVENSQFEAIDTLLEFGAKCHPASARLLSSALEDAPQYVEHFLSEGASVATVTPGEWLLDEMLCGLLKDHGLRATPNWVPQLCSGNHGKKERPSLVRAALAFGLNAETTWKGRSALAYAERVGFEGVVEVLLRDRSKTL